jgi:hypothetical protein
MMNGACSSRPWNDPAELGGLGDGLRHPVHVVQGHIGHHQVERPGRERQRGRVGDHGRLRDLVAGRQPHHGRRGVDRGHPVAPLLQEPAEPSRILTRKACHIHADRGETQAPGGRAGLGAEEVVHQGRVHPRLTVTRKRSGGAVGTACSNAGRRWSDRFLPFLLMITSLWIVTTREGVVAIHNDWRCDGGGA